LQRVGKSFGVFSEAAARFGRVSGCDGGKNLGVFQDFALHV
jgi:hypothetical protein